MLYEKFYLRDDDPDVFLSVLRRFVPRGGADRVSLFKRRGSRVRFDLFRRQKSGFSETAD